MIASIFIIIVSLALFAYWFRYTCLLVLNTKAVRDYASTVAKANQLGFLDVRVRLSQDAGSESFDSFDRSLTRDYRLLTYLLRHATSDTEEGQSIDRWILMLDYSMMKVWYAVARHFSPAQSREALLEMASIVHRLANLMGERMSVSTRT